MIKFDKILGNIRTNDVTNTEINLFANSINVTYAELFSLRDKKHLVAGKQYRITDYVTAVANDDEACSAGHRFDLLVIADDDHTINAHARAILHEGDTYFANSELNKWKIWYDIDNDTNKYAWANEDVLSYGDKYGFAGNESADKITAGSPSELTYIKEVSINGTTYYAWYGGNYGATNGNFYLTNDRFPKYGDALLETDSGFTFVEKGEELSVQKFDDGCTIHFAGRGVIYRMIDEHGNDCPYDFKNVLFKRYYADGEYLSEDFIGFDGAYDYLLATNGLDIESSIDFIADESSGWAYTFNNTTGCDFNDLSLYNELYQNFNENSFLYNKDCSSNVIKPYHTVLTVDNTNYYVAQLNNIVLMNNTTDTGSVRMYNNFFNNDCYNMTLFDNCYENSFGINCFENFLSDSYNNTFGAYCYHNLFGSNCYYNSLSNNCYSNFFACHNKLNSLSHYCYKNYFHSYCFSNILRERCHDITLGNSCYHNTFKQYCNIITFNHDCSNNTIGFDCNNITFYNNCNGNSFSSACYFMTFEGDCNYNSIKDNCSYIRLDSCCSYNVFGSGVSSLKWGGEYHNIIVEDEVSSISFVYNNKTVNYVRFVHVTHDTSNIQVICPEEPTSEKYCQNILLLTSASGKSSKSPTCCELESLNDTYTTQFGDYKIGAMSVEADEEVQS